MTSLGLNIFDNFQIICTHPLSEILKKCNSDESNIFDLRHNFNMFSAA